MPTIATSVELIFDKQLSAEIRGIWDSFTGARIRYQPHAEQGHPHITVSVREKNGGNWMPVFESLARKMNPFEIMFSSVGMFLRPAGLGYSDRTDTVVLFLSPKPTDDLFKAHRVAVTELPGWNMGPTWKNYGTEFWVPHCTLAEHLEKDDVLKAIMICQTKLIWPLTGWVRGIRLVNFGPGELQELARYSLNGINRIIT
jgi:2'-5' RNA ligase